MEPEIIAGIKREYLLGLLKEGKRPDDRGFDEYRPVSVETGVSKKAEGSSHVSIGDTQVMVGIKLILGEPYSDSPDSGVLTTNVELRPIASPTFEMGPPRENTIEVARVVDRGIRESKCIALDKLCVTPGEQVWIAFIDIHALDYHGNLFDASELGVIAALKDAYIPKIEDGRALYGEPSKEKLPINDTPIETTFVKIGDSIFLDPNLDESLAMDARLTIATKENGAICAMQKGGRGMFKPDEVTSIVDRSIKAGKELRKHVK